MLFGLPPRRPMQIAALVLASGWFCAVLSAFATPDAPPLPPPATRTVDFVKDIQPLFAANCYGCHGPKRQQGELRWDVKALALKGGEHGPVILPGHSADSRVIQLVAGVDPDAVMPPKGDRLTPEQIGLLRAWIDQGGKWPDGLDPAEYTARLTHWSFHAPDHPVIPKVKDHKWVRNPVDNFVLAHLEKQKLHPSPEADRVTLIRRVSLDLTGLPPTIAEVDAFLADHSADAYEKLVERLLASPHYGEQWGRHWLDVARYADSNGYEKDLPRSIWPYRDWVINAFNHNEPFNQFTIDQLAGDLLPNATTEQKIATGFARNSMINEEGGVDPEEFRVAAIINRVETTGKAFLGLTINCAQCHSHKYDPISQREYYQFFAFLNNDDEPFMETPSPEQKTKRAEVLKSVAKLEDDLEAKDPDLKKREAAWEERVRNDAVDWHVLDPDYFYAAVGTKFNKLSDHSLLATASSPPDSSYTIKVIAPFTNLTAFRLEAMTDPNLPHNGPGRSDKGNFVLTHITVDAIAPDGTNTNHIVLKNATADYSEPDFPVANAIAPPKDSKTNEPGTFLAGDIVKLESLASKLKNAEKDDLPAYLKSKLSATTSNLLSGYDKGVNAKLRRGLAEDLNRITRDGALYESNRFAKVKLTSETWTKTEAKPTGADLVRLNRTLLLEAFPDELSAGEHGWGINAGPGRINRNRVAVFETADNTTIPAGSTLVFTLEQTFGSQMTIGRFRLSATSRAARPIVADPLSPELHDLVKATREGGSGSEARTAEQSRKLLSLYRTFDTNCATANEKIGEAMDDWPDSDTTLVLTTGEEPRVTHLFKRGDFRNPGEVVAPGVPAFLPPLPKDAPLNRLTFAKWLVNGQNPLTARVVMNRFWQSYFGKGIVLTSEDFGTQGERPSHPELLDWLACRFVDSGWDVKAMQRLIVESATYRQSSVVTPELFAQDPYNRLLARGPRFRVEAEGIRDIALRASGLLTEKIGGPSVYPPIPDGVLNLGYGAPMKWETSTGPDRYRRGLYTFWKRSIPYPGLSIFDAPNADITCVRRMMSDTPLQALTTLNDTVFFEAAQAMALRVWKEGGKTDRDRAIYAFRLCTGRKPDAVELKSILDMVNRKDVYFEDRTSAAIQVSAPDPKSPPADVNLHRVAAWTVASRVLLNLDETVTKE